MRRLGLLILAALLAGSSLAQAAPRHGDYAAAPADAGPIRAEAREAVDLLASALDAAARGEYGAAERDIREATPVVHRLRSVADGASGVWSSTLAERYAGHLAALHQATLTTATGLFDMETALTPGTLDRADQAVDRGLVRLDTAAQALGETDLGTSAVATETEEVATTHREIRARSENRVQRVQDALHQVGGDQVDPAQVRSLAQQARFNETARHRLEALQAEASGPTADALEDLLSQLDEAPRTRLWEPLVRLRTGQVGVEAGEPLPVGGSVYTGRFSENATVALRVGGETVATFEPGAGPFTRTVETPSDLQPGPHTLTASVRPPGETGSVANVTTRFWVQEPTSLSIEPASGTFPQGSRVSLTVHLSSAGDPVPNATVQVGVGPAKGRATTNPDGAATVTGAIPDVEAGPVTLRARFPGTRQYAPARDQVNVTYGSPTAGQASLQAEAGAVLPPKESRPVVATATALLGLLGLTAASRWRGDPTPSSGGTVPRPGVGATPTGFDELDTRTRGTQPVERSGSGAPLRSRVTELNPGEARFTPHRDVGLEAAFEELEAHPDPGPELVERYREVLAELADSGHPVATLTPREAAEILSDLGFSPETTRTLTELYEETRFGGEASTP